MNKFARFLNKLLKVKVSGEVSLVGLGFVIIIGGILLAGTLYAGPKLLDNAKVYNLRRGLASLEAVATQMMYERDGLISLTGSDGAAFANIFNMYVDSNAALDTSGQLKLKDPWGMGYFVSFEKESGAESKVFIESKGKFGGDMPSHVLLIHYKNGEVRVGTSGFNSNTGEDTSDASFDDESGAEITTLFSD